MPRPMFGVIQEPVLQLTMVPRMLLPSILPTIQHPAILQSMVPIPAESLNASGIAVFTDVSEGSCQKLTSFLSTHKTQMVKSVDFVVWVFSLFRL